MFCCIQFHPSKIRPSKREGKGNGSCKHPVSARGSFDKPVFPDYNPSESSTEENGTGFNLNLSDPIIIGAGAAMIFVGGAWVTIRRRR